MSKRKKRAPRNQPGEPPALLLLSYVPLLRGKAGTVHDLHRDKGDARALAALLDQAPSGRAAACLWMLDGQGSPMPVLALEQAQAIAGHLIEWADNEPAKWFRVYLKERDGRYALALFPELQRSLERFRFAHLLEGGSPLDSGRIQIITRPLHFVSGTGTAYAVVRDRIGDSVHVGLVDLALLDPDDPFRLDPAMIRDLGAFTVGAPGTPGAGAFLDEILAEPIVPPSNPSRLNPAAAKQAADSDAAGRGGRPAR
jgi:hypothetical protein